MDIIEAGERAEAQIDAMIRRSDERRRLREGERAEHELWMETVERHNAKRRAELVFAWVEYHEQAAERALSNGRAIADRHLAAIEALLGENGHEENGNGRH